ncbi:MAG: acyltransferase [Prevotella sp.]|nr:acyltransferase [Prevotella sp.]
MDKNLSAAITWLRFPIVVMIVMLHCYSVALDKSVCQEGFFRAVYPFALWLGETGVPLAFFISGYLFFISQKTYKEKLNSRFHSLFVPYIFWNSLILLVYVVLMWLGHPLEIARKSIADYTWLDYLNAYWIRGKIQAGNGVPLLCPYWFIRNLMILCVISPIIYYGIKKSWYLVWLLLTAWWISVPHNAMIPSSLLFFSLGATFSIHRQNLLALLSRYSQLLLITWGIATFLDILLHWLHIEGAFYFHRCSIVLNIFAMIWLAVRLTHGKVSDRMAFLSQSSFWVFSVHYPFVVFLRKSTLYVFNSSTALTQIGMYGLFVVIVMVLSIVTYLVMYKTYPRFVRFATGNRV